MQMTNVIVIEARFIKTTPPIIRKGLLFEVEIDSHTISLSDVNGYNLNRLLHLDMRVPI
jgi:hypothetical protein